MQRQFSAWIAARYVTCYMLRRLLVEKNVAPGALEKPNRPSIEFIGGKLPVYVFCQSIFKLTET